MYFDVSKLKCRYVWQPASHMCLPQWWAFDSMGRSYVWTVEWLTISTSNRQLETCRPADVLVNGVSEPGNA